MRNTTWSAEDNHVVGCCTTASCWSNSSSQRWTTVGCLKTRFHFFDELITQKSESWSYNLIYPQPARWGRNFIPPMEYRGYILEFPFLLKGRNFFPGTAPGQITGSNLPSRMFQKKPPTYIFYAQITGKFVGWFLTGIPTGSVRNDPGSYGPPLMRWENSVVILANFVVY